MKKKTIHFNDAQLKELDTLISLLGIRGYGDIPKALAFSVTFTLNRLKSDANVLPELNEGDLEKWFSSINKIKNQEKREELAEKILKEGDK